MLHPDYRQILTKAWSVRLMLLAGVLSTAEAVLPLFADSMPRGVFAGATAVSVIGALFARVTLQKNLGYGAVLNATE